MKQQQILEYWNDAETESMYDKYLLEAEINLIKQYLSPNSKILDAGCGEGEGTLVYASIPGVEMYATDYSHTRLKKAEERLKNCANVTLLEVNFLDDYSLPKDFDYIISQRFLINLSESKLQHQVLLDLMLLLKPGGKLLMLEGSKQGAEFLNSFRVAWGLEPIPVKWHNLFFDDAALVTFMKKNGYSLVEESGLGTYFFLTRGIKPALQNDLNWQCEFNKTAASKTMQALLGFTTEFSRLKLWIFEK